MSTVEEFRKQFAEGNVLKGVDWIFSLARSLEERLEALEKGAALVDTKHGVISVAEHIVDVRERLEALEKHEHLLDMGDGRGARHLADVLRERLTVNDPELDRQARWHATRDAAIAAIANGQWKMVKPHEGAAPKAQPDVDAIIVYASAIADGSHGPLEGKAGGKQSELAEAAIDAIAHSLKPFKEPT